MPTAAASVSRPSRARARARRPSERRQRVVAQRVETESLPAAASARTSCCAQALSRPPFPRAAQRGGDVAALFRGRGARSRPRRRRLPSARDRVLRARRLAWTWGEHQGRPGARRRPLQVLHQNGCGSSQRRAAEEERRRHARAAERRERSRTWPARSSSKVTATGNRSPRRRRGPPREGPRQVRRGSTASEVTQLAPEHPPSDRRQDLGSRPRVVFADAVVDERRARARGRQAGAPAEDERECEPRGRAQARHCDADRGRRVILTARGERVVLAPCSGTASASTV